MLETTIAEVRNEIKELNLSMDFKSRINNILNILADQKLEVMLKDSTKDFFTFELLNGINQVILIIFKKTNVISIEMIDEKNISVFSKVSEYRFQLFAKNELKKFIQ